MDEQTKADALQERLIDFGVRVIRLSGRLPVTVAGRHLANQVMRSGTSPVPNYGEARGAESRADFVHKLAIVLKELNETLIWLRMIQRSRLVAEDRLTSLVQENEQLARIITASLKTTRTAAPR